MTELIVGIIGIVMFFGTIWYIVYKLKEVTKK